MDLSQHELAIGRITKDTLLHEKGRYIDGFASGTGTYYDCIIFEGVPYIIHWPEDPKGVQNQVELERIVEKSEITGKKVDMKWISDFKPKNPDNYSQREKDLVKALRLGSMQLASSYLEVVVTEPQDVVLCQGK